MKRPTEKYRIVLTNYRPDASRVKALQAFQEVTRLDVQMSAKILKLIPISLYHSGCEAYYEMIFDPVEAAEAKSILKPFFGVELHPVARKF